MRIRECSSPPSLVVEWLCKQLAKRNISTPSTHANALLSVLHCYYCTNRHQSNGQTLLAETDNPVLDPQGLLELKEHLLLGENTHPDADLPSVTPLPSIHNDLNSCKEKQQWNSSQDSNKLAAISCLLSACQENRQDAEGLIEELVRLLHNSIEISSSIPFEKLSSSLPPLPSDIYSLNITKKRSSNSISINTVSKEVPKNTDLSIKICSNSQTTDTSSSTEYSSSPSSSNSNESKEQIISNSQNISDDERTNCERKDEQCASLETRNGHPDCQELEEKFTCETSKLWECYYSGLGGKMASAGLIDRGNSLPTSSPPSSLNPPFMHQNMDTNQFNPNSYSVWSTAPQDTETHNANNNNQRYKASIWQTNLQDLSVQEDATDGGYFGDISSRESSEDRQTTCFGAVVDRDDSFRDNVRKHVDIDPDQIFDKLPLNTGISAVVSGRSSPQKMAELYAVGSGFCLSAPNNLSLQTVPTGLGVEGAPKNHVNIWSGADGNKILSERNNVQYNCEQTKRENFEAKDEDTLCENFQSLGLQRLWENGKEQKNLELQSKLEESDVWANRNSSEQLQQHPLQMQNQRQQLEFMNQPFINSNAILQQVYEEQSNQQHILPQYNPISGPLGVQAVLQHSHHSNFSSVVPKRTDMLASDFSKIPGSRIIPASVSENLLTSPRTHFRPIAIQEDSAAAVGNSGNNSPVLTLTYQRSNSGSLYLEKDFIDGSPKKYMVYKEPQEKLSGDSVQMQKLNQEGSLVPKFKVVKNEKFCQTEEEVYSNERDGDVDYVCDVFAFQKSDLNFGTPPSYCMTGKYGVLPSAPDIASMVGMERLQAKDAAVSSEQQQWDQSDPQTDSASNKFCMRAEAIPFFSKMSEESVKPPRVLDTPAANAIWSSEPRSDAVLSNYQFKQAMKKGGLNSAIKALWANSPQEKDVASVEEFTPHSFNEDSLPGWSMVKSNKNESNFLQQMPNDWMVEDSIFGVEPIKQNSDSIEGSTIKIPEIGPLSVHEPWSTGDDEVRTAENDKAIWSQEAFWLALKQQKRNDERSDSMSSDLAELLEAQKWEQMVSMGEAAANGGTGPQEDLEELDPGWTLQEGFVWGGPQNENNRMLSQEDLRHQVSVDDDSESLSSNANSDVLMVSTVDGNTLAVPVEYLETDVYDQLFGTGDGQLSSSLPDMPNNEEQLKKLRERWLPAWRRPCTFFMEGTCRRKHCKFSHDLSSITCRFWEEGTCLKGDECPFLHGYPAVTRRRNHSEGDSRSASEGRGLKSCEKLRGFSHHTGKNSRASSASVSSKFRHRHSSFELASEADFPSLGSNTDVSKESDEKCAISSHVNSLPNVPHIVNAKKKNKIIGFTVESLHNSSKPQHGGSTTKGRRRRNTQSPNPSSSHKPKSSAPPMQLEKPLSYSELNNNGSKVQKGRKVKKITDKVRVAPRGKGPVKGLGSATKGNKNKTTSSFVHHDGTVSDY